MPTKTAGTLKTATNAKPAGKEWRAEGNRRRSMRVLLRVAIIVEGRIAQAPAFREETHTLVVNAHGALILLAAAVVPGQSLTVVNKTTQAHQECSVVYVGSAQGGKTQVALEFAEPAPSFWPVDFPPGDWKLAGK